ncbi:Uncharacterised protein [Mycobacteroides abscessus subsp. massiliense]|nr:Uncharacterised protein [Mycobacteroides abscessus subsp. massiliense]
MVQTLWRGNHDGEVEIPGHQLCAELCSVRLFEQYPDTRVSVPERSEQIGDMARPHGEREPETHRPMLRVRISGELAKSAIEFGQGLTRPGREATRLRG